MSWSLGYDEKWKRDIGYGVPAFCDHPGCMKEIDRGLSYVCGGEPFGGEEGCGLYFCPEHLEGTTESGKQCCARCANGEEPFAPSSENPQWIRYKLLHESWQEWREVNPEEVARLRENAVPPLGLSFPDSDGWWWARAIEGYLPGDELCLEVTLESPLNRSFIQWRGESYGMDEERFSGMEWIKAVAPWAAPAGGAA